MKKIIIFIISALLSLGLVACGNTDSYAFDGHNWNMTTIQSVKQNGDFVAYAPSDDTFDKEAYPNAVAVEMTCSAKNGTFSIANKTDGKTYEGTYKTTSRSKGSTIYEIEIGEQKGTAVVSETKYNDESKNIVLIISIGDYALNFQSK